MGDHAASEPAIVEIFGRHPEIQFAYLFGSHAEGRAGPLSDVDLAVCLAPEFFEQVRGRPDYELGLKAELVRALNRSDLDVILLNETPVMLAHQVLRKGRLLFCRDHRSRIAHFVRVSSLYPDLCRLQQPHYLRILRRIDEGQFGVPDHG